MSFAKVISLISTMTPTGIGFFGYTWEILGNFFVYIFTYVVNAFYGVCKWFLAFVDFLQYFIQKLIGLDYWLSPGGKDLKGATESDLLFSFLYNETVQDVFRALIGLFIVFLIIFTVFAIIRQEWKFVTGTEKDNTKGKILSGSLKAIALVVITPLILVIGIVSSNAILASIVKALNIDMSSTFGNTIFSIASVNANKYRIYTDSGERTPVSQQVTFYINSDEELVLYGSAASDEYQKVYDDYDEYLEAIDSADKYTVNSMLPIVIPSQHSEFYGYCISLNIDGNLKYFMVEVDVDNANSAESKEKISAMYYYLRNVLRANIMSRNNNIGSADILKALGGDISSAVSTTPCLISEFDLDGCKEDKVYEACYNTWDYATIYRTETAFEATTASTLVMNLDDYYISGQSNAKIVYNAYDYQKYFDGGQFGFVGLNAEYGVMTDVIDFICETGANLYILDATSSLINWNYEDYQIEGKWVSEITGGAPTMYNAYGEEYLPFIVDYSETAMDHEEGKTLYFAKANVSNELEGSKFIMCWKVSTDSGVKYVPLLNRETFTDPVTKQTYTFKSTYLSNSYKGLVVAKGNFDQEITSSVNGPDNGDPTYFKVGASLGDGEEAIEYTNEPYYYDIAESGELQQYVSDLDVSAHAQNNMTLKNINFDNSSFPNYALVFDSIDKSLFRFVDTNTNAEVDITTNIINSLTVRFVNGSNKNDSAVYAGVNDGTNYLFVSSGTGRVLMLSLTDSRTLTVRGIGEDGSISTSRVVPSEIESSVNNFNSPIFLYKITLNYDDGHETDTYEIKPLDLQFSKTADGKSLFSSIEKYYIVMNGASTDIKQNMTICAYFNESSLYNIVDGKLEMATFSASNKYTLQMFRVSLYDFMVGYVDGAVCKYVASNSEGHRVVTAGDSDIVDSFDFGIVVDGFEWIEDNTEYSVFNGSSYIAKLLKTKGTTFGIENVAEDSKTIGIEIDGNRYYNVKTQNMYSDEDSMEDAYDIINNSMFVGCYRDRATTDFWSCDFHFSLVGNFRFKLKLNLPVLENEQLMNKNYGVFSLTDGIAFDYFFEGDNSLVQFYNAYKVAYWIILIASALIIKTLGTALWGVIKRFYEVTLYYLAMPIAASTMPLDGGKKFGQIQEGLIKNVLGAYGVILGINMFFILLSPVKSLSNIFTQAEMDSSTSYFLRHFPFGAKVLNNYVYILFVLVAFTMIDTLPSVINGLVGGKDVVAEGKTTKENVQKSVKSAGDMISGKSAMDFAGKTVSALSQTPMAAPIKWAAGKVKGGVDSVIGSFNRGASQDDDDAAQKGGDKQKSSRADGSDETQTTSQETGETAEATEATEANETTEMQNANSRADGEFEEGENSNAADESQEADIAAEFNKEQANAELGEEGKVDAIKEAAENGEKQELTNAIATNIVGDKETLNKENAAEFGLDENAVREIVRQMLGEQGKNMSDEELDKFAIAIDKDVFGNIKGATVKTTDENGNEQEVASVDGEQASKAIVENASNEKVKEAYSNLDDDQKDMVDGAIAADASGVSFSEEKHKEATDEQKTEAIKDMAKSDENQEVSNAIAGELIDKKMNETAQQNDNEEPAVEVAEIDKDYAAELGIDKKLEAGQTISAEEAGISESEAQRIKEDILGSKEVELNKNQQTAISKNLRNLGVEEGQVVSEKQSGLDKDELLELKKNTLGAKAENMSPEQLDKYELIFAKDEKGNVSASLQIPTDDISDEELKKHKLEFTKDENGVISAKVTAPEEENKTDVAATIDASAVLTEEQIRQIISDILGEKATGLTEEQLAEYKLQFTRDENGNMSASVITPPQTKEYGFELEEEYASEIGIDEKLQAGQTISAEEAGISEEQMSTLKDMALGEEGEKLSDEELAKYKLEFTKDENGVVSAKVTAPEDENKTDVAATIDASAVLSEEQIRQIISESLGEKTTGQTSEQRQEIKLDDKQMASVNSKILENASDEEVNGAYQNLGNNLKAKVDSYASENFAEKEVVNVAPENATLANASLNALRAIDKYKDDENVENAVILKTLEADPEKMKSFMYESGLSENASKDEKLEVIAQMKNSQNANAVSMTLKDINEKGLTDAHAQVVAEMMADGKIKTTAWDLATEEEKQQFRQKRKDEKQEFSADEKKVATELNMQAVRDYEAADKADYDKKIVDAYVSSENIEFKDTLSTNLLLSATGLKNETGKAYKDAAKEIQSAELSDGKKINMAELAQKGYSPEMVMAAYAKMKILADKDGKIGEDSVKNDNGKLNAELLMKMLEKPNDNTDIALSKLTDSDVKARAIVSDMLMKGDKDSTPLLTSDEQEGIVAKIAEGDGKGGFLAEQSGSKEFYDKVVAETQKRNQVNEIYDTQSDNIDVKQLNDFGNTQILQNKVMGAMIETSEGGGDNFKNSKDYADLLREFTGDTKTKHGQDKSDKEMTQSYKIIATKDEKGNYSYSVGKKVNGKIVETKALTEDQVRSLQEKYMKNFKSGTIENSKLKSAFDKLSAAEQSLLASRNKDKGKAMQDLFANNDNNSNYQALLDQINAMRTKAGEANVSEITSADLQKLINNEDNLGYDPIELENLKKEIIRQKIDSSESQVITKVVDSSKLSGKEKDNFEYRKTIIEDQVKAEGDNSETLANLFKNSNFVGKDELQKEIEDIINNLKDKQENKDKSNEQLFAMALNQRLAVKNESEIQSEIKNYMEANAGVSKEEAETVVRQKNQQAENTRNLLYSVGATDVTKAISDDNLKDKQKEAIKSDIVLSRQLADAGIKETDSDYDAKLQALMASNASFALRLNEKVQNMIDPSKQISAEDKERFFKSKSQEDLTTKKFGPITEGIKAKNKTRKHLPKESKKYDEWNNLIDKDMEAVKSGKGAYKNLSKEDRKAKLDELKSKKINTERPEDYYDWDYAKQKEYDDNQNILKNEALNTNISKVKKKDIKAFKPKDKNVILKFADATGDKLSDVPVLRAITSKFASDDLKAKHNKELLLEEEKIARFNSSAPMRKRSEDFGSNFENFAKSYISKKSIDRIQKDVASKGLTGEAAIKAREEAFAKQMNKNYKVASAKVARDNRVDKNEFLVEKGINAGSVRYKDGTKKYTEVKSRLGRKTAKIVQKYEKEYASGNVSDKTRKKYEKSTFANRSEEAAIKVKNQQKLYDQVVEFNRSYKRGDGDYATLFKQKFGDELYKKYNSAGIRDLEKSPAIVQQRELIKRIENELKKNINRQKYSSYIPASDKAKDRFRADTLTNAKTKAAVEHDRQMMAHFSNAMKQFKAQTAGGKTINPDEFMKSINPAVLGKHLQDFKGVDNEFIKNYLEKGFEKYRKRVVNNSFTPSQLQNLVKLNGTYVDKSKVQNSRISNTVLKSLRASDAEVYKNIIKSVNSARAKADNEAANLQSLKQALKSAQSGVQNNAAKAEAEKIRKAIANSEIKLNNLKNVLGAEEARKKAFEQAIASDRIKKAIRENSKSAPAAPSRPHDYSKPDGSPRIIKPGTLDHRQVQKLERYFMANARAELENMAKLIASKESQKLVDEINKTRRDLSYDARENVKKLKALQLKIKKELKNLVTKNDKKTKRYQDELKMQNAKIDGTIKKMSEEFAKMDIII